MFGFAQLFICSGIGPNTMPIKILFRVPSQKPSKLNNNCSGLCILIGFVAASNRPDNEHCSGFSSPF
jgi:hypothetical protein